MIIPFNNSPGTKDVGSHHLKITGHLEGKVSLTDNRKVMEMDPIIMT